MLITSINHIIFIENFNFNEKSWFVLINLIKMIKLHTNLKFKKKIRELI